MKNRKIICWQDNTLYFYIDHPIVIVKIYEQIHMAKICYIENKKKTIIGIEIIREEPSKDLSISINWLRRNIE